MKLLLNLSREEHIRMQHQARRLVRDQFTWQRIAGDLATHYREMVRTS
jgi:glycosyltransferase involved in cell wall biosynthesis